LLLTLKGWTAIDETFFTVKDVFLQIEDDSDFEGNMFNLEELQAAIFI
jgi:hypothetical protein